MNRNGLGAVLLAVAASTSAAAQQPDSAVDPVVHRLPEVRVEVTRLGVGGVPLARTPFAAQVISGERLHDQGFLTVADALARLPGISLADEIGSPYQPDITIRGFGVSPVVGLPQGLSVFVDGVRVNEPDANQVNFELIPMGDVERIEVLRGPSGPFGKNALGGSINIVTRRGGRDTGGFVDLAGGEFGFLEGRGAYGGEIGSFDYYLSGRYLRDEGWRDAAYTRLGQLFAKGGWRNETTDVWVSYTFASDSLLQAGSIPVSWLETPDSVPARWRTHDPRTINFTGGDYFGPSLHFVTAQLHHRLAEGLGLEANVFYRQNEIAQFNANFTEPDTRMGTEIRSVGGAAQLSYLRERLEVTGGVEYSYNDVGITIFEHPNENFPDIPTVGELSEDVGTKEHDVALFSQARYAASPRLGITAALRFDYVSLPFRDLLEPENNGDNLFRQFTTMAGVDYVVAPGTVIFASYGRGFRAPTIMELACADPDDPCPLPYELGADPPLEPVTTDTWQAGLRVFRGTFSAEAVGYWAEVHDDIFNVQPPGVRSGFFQNLDRTRRQGLELAMSLRPHEAVLLSGDLTYTLATFRTVATLTAPYHDDNDDEADEDAEVFQEADNDLAAPTVRPGSEFPMVPKIRANLGVEYAAGPWKAGLAVDYVGRQWLRGDEDNSEDDERLDPYTLVGIRVERSILDRLTVYLGVSNLLDTEYNTFGVLSLNRLNDFESPRVEAFVTPGPTRRIQGGMRIRF